jgi:uroporphyrinogen decarboxylase
MGFRVEIKLKSEIPGDPMNSQERVLAALNHREPDRVPIDFDGYRGSSIAAMGYVKLRKYLGLPAKTVYVYDPIQQLAQVDEDVLERFGADAIEVGRGFPLDESAWVDWVLPDGTPCKMPVWATPERHGADWVLRSQSGRILARMPKGGLYFSQEYFPLAEKTDFDNIPGALAEAMWSGIPAPPGPLAEGPEGLRKLAEGAQALRSRTERAIVGFFGGSLFEAGQFTHRNDNFYMLLAGEPKQAHAFLDRLVEVHLANLEKYLGAVGKWIDLIVFTDDLGMQTGPQISPAMYREFFKPRHKIMWARAKQLANVKVNLHSCGGFRELLPDLIEAGAEAINPVQISARGMNPRELKAEFGKDLVFWGGGCDTQEVLPNGTPEAVRRHVQKQVRILSPGGGFVFQPVHNIQANILPENIVAMFDAVNARA